MRQCAKTRKTAETEITVNLNIDGNGQHKINTGIKFFDHMLEQLAHHAGFDLEIEVTSHDKDNHHIVEDVAITLGQAFLEALPRHATSPRTARMRCASCAQSSISANWIAVWQRSRRWRQPRNASSGVRRFARMYLTIAELRTTARVVRPRMLRR